ncbi:class I SAM-dependent methyltransferase [Cylindrospermopsis curvispora]|nr:class I SAM-dependent methyltransferase [Cylindrospermopsis curvispora]
MGTHKTSRLLYQVEDLPVFQNRMYDSELEAKDCQKGSMHLVESAATGLIYNESFCSSLVKYDQHYQNEQALSPVFQKHLQNVALIIEDKIGKTDLVEVGCGKGFFLELLTNKGFNVTGFDPTYEGSNPNIQREYFTSGLGFHSRGLVLRHVLEHIQDPVNFLFQLKDANKGEGKIYIEVPCFDWICQRRAWFDIYYEHVNYFRLSDFHRLFSNVMDSGQLFGGQYIYVVAELASLQVPKIDFYDRVDFPSNFLLKLTQHESKETDRIGVWGGASKGVIFSLLMSRLGNTISAVIDINPAKQKRYLPATGIKVSSPVEVFDLLPKDSKLFVMNSNYLEEIREMSRHCFNYVSIDND